MNIVRNTKNINPCSDKDEVSLKVTGNIVEVRYMKVKRVDCPIKKINSEHYVDKRTGEIKDFSHGKTTRISNKASVAQSLKRLRDIINTNLTTPNKALWITLTYKENMKDTQQLYNDFRKFWQRFCYYLNKNNLPKAEYITAAEPQARGAWHLHCLFIFDKKAPYIPNDKISQIWKVGFTKTKSLKHIDNPGLYLTAYLGDMELTETTSAGIKKSDSIIEVDSTNEQGETVKKAIIKGARLNLYPRGFNLYRCSRGIKRPIVFSTTEGEAKKIIGNAPKIYEKTIALTDEFDKTINVINYRKYNIAKR